MADLTGTRTDAAVLRDGWQDDNDRGLSLAADGDWSEATEAFATAADSLARTLPSQSGAHEPLALVLGNLAQSCFHAGRVEEAIQHQQRVTALRVTLTGEDGMPVARARMDLAVMLASAGHVDEAWTLIQRVIASVEHRVGGEDPRLSVVLENAARIALAANTAANAEPLLLRLHALLDAHQLSTARADHLLAQVASVRTPQANAAPMPFADVAGADVDGAPAEEALPQVYAHASIAAQEDWEDQPLRDAVAVTDVLLRTTPSGVPAIPSPPLVEPPMLEFDLADAQAEADAMLDIRSATGASLSMEAAHPADGLDFALDLAFPEDGLGDVTVDDALPELPPAASRVPSVPDNHMSTAETAGLTGPTHVSPTRTPPAGSLGGFTLDFAVDHSVIDDDAPAIEGPPISSPIPELAPSDAFVIPPVAPTAPLRVAPVEGLITVGPTTGIKPLEGVESATPPISVPAIPAPTPGTAASGADMARRTPTPPTPPTPPTQRTPRRAAEHQQVPAKTKSGGNTMLYLVGAAVVIGGGAAAFFLLR